MESIGGDISRISSGSESQEQDTIDIQPPVSIYGTYKRLSYQPWYAIAEFVDNSTQNFFEHEEELTKAFKADGGNKLRVDITLDETANRLDIRDNANGMDFEELTRAIVLNTPPPKTDGRCEYGMGLKTAATWFGDFWRIKTKRLGKSLEYEAVMDIQNLGNNKFLKVSSKLAKPEDQYTILTIEKLHRNLKGARTKGRIKAQLSSMYREDIRSGKIEIIWNGETLKYPDPVILKETQKDGRTTTWRKDVRFKVPYPEKGTELDVYGWIGILQTMNSQQSGFALLRRNRVIAGGPDSNYKPPDIFGAPNSGKHRRLMGELHLDNWPISHTKDMFDWHGGLEDEFLKKLAEVCADYMHKAAMSKIDPKEISKGDFDAAGEPTENIISNPEFGKALALELKAPAPMPTVKQEAEDIEKIKAVSLGPRTFKIHLDETEWKINVSWQGDLSNAPWMSIDFPKDDEINVYLNSGHQFFQEYIIEGGRTLELIIKMVVALALAEKLARKIHHNNLIEPSYFRTHMNRVLALMSEIHEEVKEEGGVNE